MKTIYILILILLFKVTLISPVFASWPNLCSSGLSDLISFQTSKSLEDIFGSCPSSDTRTALKNIGCTYNLVTSPDPNDTQQSSAYQNCQAAKGDFLSTSSCPQINNLCVKKKTTSSSSPNVFQTILDKIKEILHLSSPSQEVFSRLGEINANGCTCVPNANSCNDASDFTKDSTFTNSKDSGQGSCNVIGPNSNGTLAPGRMCCKTGKKKTTTQPIITDSRDVPPPYQQGQKAYYNGKNSREPGATWQFEVVSGFHAKEITNFYENWYKSHSYPNYQLSGSGEEINIFGQYQNRPVGSDCNTSGVYIHECHVFNLMVPFYIPDDSNGFFTRGSAIKDQLTSKEIRCDGDTIIEINTSSITKCPPNGSSDWSLPQTQNFTDPRTLDLTNNNKINDNWLQRAYRQMGNSIISGIRQSPFGGILQFFGD